MGTTANGLPYPEPTDPIAAGAAAIHALAEGVRVLSGSAVLPAGGTTAGVSITFPSGFFTSTPIVVVSTASVWVTASGGSASASGFAIGAIHRQASGQQQSSFPTGVVAYWVAVGLTGAATYEAATDEALESITRDPPGGGDDE